MSQAEFTAPDLVALDFVKHKLQCPHCEKRTVYRWPGRMILFATVKCAHCARRFLVAMDKPHLDLSCNSA